MRRIERIIFTIAIGVRPRTVPDIAYHAGIIVLLEWGLRVASRAPAHAASRRS